VVVGVLQILDHGEADDKIIAILENDHIYGHVRSIEELPNVIVERLKHYFRTYKMVEGQEPDIKIIGSYGAEKAKKIVNAAIEDYNDAFGNG
jgi:inorganic pyrophosphatase